MFSYIIFNPNQEKKPQGNKVVQYFKNLNSVITREGTDVCNNFFFLDVFKFCFSFQNNCLLALIFVALSTETNYQRVLPHALTTHQTL